MHVIKVRNVQEALPSAIALLLGAGKSRESRYGRVIQAPYPVTTEYERPWERVLFYPERDANPFFHLYESLWMLAGRNDLAPLTRYVKSFSNFSDDGKTIHDAYGHRWRKHFGFDQLTLLIDTLRRNHDDRRCVLQMWDPTTDLGRPGKAFPCNTAATFQVATSGDLELTVFCRSNDVIMGAYGANAVHMSILHEYVARMANLSMGTYRQVSVNWHVYEKDLTPGLREIAMDPFDFDQMYDEDHRVRATHLFYGVPTNQIDVAIATILNDADNGPYLRNSSGVQWIDVLNAIFFSHWLYVTNEAPKKFELALGALGTLDPSLDWVVASRDWIERRQRRWEAKQS